MWMLELYAETNLAIIKEIQKLAEANHELRSQIAPSKPSLLAYLWSRVRGGSLSKPNQGSYER